MQYFLRIIDMHGMPRAHGAESDTHSRKRGVEAWIGSIGIVKIAVGIFH
jgi:hypothetical protein